MVEILESYQDLNSNDKVATIDMGGTMVSDPNNSSTHARINTALGLSKKEEKYLYQEFVGENGDIKDHVEHARAQTDALRSRQSACIDVYAETVQDIINDRELNPGATDFVNYLQDLGYQTVIVSSAPKAATIPFARDLGVESLYRWKDFEFTDEGYFDRVKVKKEARYGKQDIVEGLQSQGIKIAHFGNGSNDKKAVKMADAGIRQNWDANPEKAFEYAFKEAINL